MKRKRTKKIPRNGARRAGAPQIPIQVERYLAIQFGRMAESFRASVHRIVFPKIKSFARSEREEHTDAKSTKGSAKAVATQVKAAADKAFSKAAVRSASESASRRIDSHSKDQFKKLNIKIKKEPELKWLVDGWAKDVASNIKGMTDNQAAKIHDILANGGARHAKSIARDIEATCDVTRSQAEVIARKSVLRLNAKITRHRQKAAGFEFYIWTTCGDERVRPAHEELDGEVFDVDGDGDPQEGHPGDADECRCVQYPLEGEDAEDAADE